ncbi:glycoside hydrolase family 32 protein [Ornithinimicrobium pratense]|nr:glycoside hydrolase family 32 protein [Ornithinimicrobium pratense]
MTSHLRPTRHFTPRSTWMNDPNGLVFVDGVYHLFFQTNPEGVEWGNMSWGHATSPDLLTWTEHDVALRFSEQEAVFSGSVVVDHGNTSGLGDGDAPPLVALYTSHYEVGSPRAGTQAQSLAWSTDGGMTWRRYPGNPVLCRQSADFRDPKVFGHPTGWVMVAVEANHRQVVLYRSDDLLAWEHLSTFGPLGSTEGVWECPDLFELPVDGGPQTAWVLVVSLGAGGPAGGSGTQYFVGDFDDRTFTPLPGDTGRWLDVGPDHYAAVSFDNTGDRRIMIGWASNWAYARRTPTPTWRSSMSLAREVSLRRSPGGRPVLHQDPVLPDDLLQHRLAVPAGVRSTLTLTTDEGRDPLVLTVDAGADRITLDRSRCGDVTFSPDFPTVVEAPLPDRDGAVDVLVVVDASVVEVYALDGALTLTAQVFPSAPLTTLGVDAA